MNYGNKRRSAGLKAPYVAYKLGINLKQYREVEANKRGLSAERIELFNSLIAQPNASKLEQMQLIKEAREWYNNNDIMEIIHKMGYSISTYAIANGISKSKAYYYLHKYEDRIVDEGILEVYIFLTNENNRLYGNNIEKLKEELVINKKPINDIRFTNDQNNAILDEDSIMEEEVKEPTMAEDTKPTQQPIEEPKKEEHDFKDAYIEYLSETNRTQKDDIKGMERTIDAQEIRIKELEAELRAKEELISNLEGLLNNLSRNN